SEEQYNNNGYQSLTTDGYRLRGTGSADVPVAVRVTVAVGRRFLLRLLRHCGLRGEQHASDGPGVLHGRPGDLDRVDDALRHQVAVLLRGRVEALAVRQIGGPRHARPPP